MTKSIRSLTARRSAARPFSAHKRLYGQLTVALVVLIVPLLLGAGDIAFNLGDMAVPSSIPMKYAGQQKNKAEQKYISEQSRKTDQKHTSWQHRKDALREISWNGRGGRGASANSHTGKVAALKIAALKKERAALLKALATEKAKSAEKAAAAARAAQQAKILTAQKAKAQAEAKKARLEAQKAAKLAQDAQKAAAVAQKAAAEATRRNKEDQQEQEVALQNLTTKFISPKGKAVPNLAIEVTVQEKNRPQRLISNLTTDANGEVNLTRIKLPAALDWNLKAPENSEEDAEWDFADIGASNLLIAQPMGQEIRSNRVAQRSNSVLGNTRMASLDLPVGVSPINATRVAFRPKVIVHEIEYHAHSTPITVQRNRVDLDIIAPAGSVISSPALPEALTVPETGRVSCHFKRKTLDGGPIALRVGRTLLGGECESVITSYETDPDPDTTNEVTAPPLELVRLTEATVLGNLSVTSNSNDIVGALGDLKGKGNKNNALGKITELPDGSQWWTYTANGIAFRLRPSPFDTSKKAPLLIDRIRLFRSSGGAIGGVTTGTKVDALTVAWGEPEVKEDTHREVFDTFNAPGQIDTYLAGGLRVCRANDEVQWIDIIRPTPYLLKGTTAFVPRRKAKLFVRSFSGHERTVLENVNDLERYFTQVNSVDLVKSPEDADMILDAKVTDFSEKKEELTELIPYKYECTTHLSYSLIAAENSQNIVHDKEVEGTSKVNYTKDIGLSTVAGVALGKIGGTLGKIGAGVIGVATLESLHRKMQKAANRCPGLSARIAFNGMISDVNRASDFAVQVTGIDYTRGTITINAGRAEGVEVSSKQDRHEFQVMVGGRELPAGEETGRSADYYAAVVKQVDEHSSVCQLIHVSGNVKNAEDDFDRDPAPEMVRRIPDPLTGLVSARAWVQFPSIDVISDKDIADSLAKAEEEGQAAK